MMRIARSLGQRDLGRQVERQLGERIDVSFLQAVAAVEALSGAGNAPTIKDLARQLDVHQSRASRLVKDTIRAGLVARLASQEDGRKSPLALSEKGKAIARAIEAARTKYFAARLQGFSNADRYDLARLLEQFAENDDKHRGSKGRAVVEANGDGAVAAGKSVTRRRRKRAGA